MIDEASRERFIYPFPEYGSYYTVRFVKLAIAHFGYSLVIIQTDNGPEFTNIRPTKRKHAFDILCEQLGITHKLIRPLTHWHNGKVERSHRNNQERFYNHMSFYDYEDLKLQMRRCLYRANRIPIEKRCELMARFKPAVNCLKSMIKLS